MKRKALVTGGCVKMDHIWQNYYWKKIMMFMDYYQDLTRFL